MADHLRKFESLLTRESDLTGWPTRLTVRSHPSTNANDRTCHRGDPGQGLAERRTSGCKSTTERHLIYPADT